MFVSRRICRAGSRDVNRARATSTLATSLTRRVLTTMTPANANPRRSERWYKTGQHRHYFLYKQGSHRPQTLPLVLPPGKYFKRPKSSLVRPLACSWYICAQLIAKPKAACALRFSWAATSSNLGLWANMTSSVKPEVHNLSLRRHGRTEPRP